MIIKLKSTLEKFALKAKICLPPSITQLLNKILQLIFTLWVYYQRFFSSFCCSLFAVCISPFISLKRISRSYGAVSYVHKKGNIGLVFEGFLGWKIYE